MKFKIYKNNNILAGYENTLEEAQSACDRQKTWYYQKEGKFTKEEIKQHVLWLCINKQLEISGLGYRYSDIKKGATHEYFTVGYTKQKSTLFGLIKWKSYSHEKVIWYKYLTFKTKEEFNEWMKYCIQIFMLYYKINSKQAEISFGWFNLNYGLKQEYLYDNN